MLVTSVGISYLGLRVPAELSELRKPRSHNEQKFLLEFLGRHQLAYFTYFLAVGFGANFWSKYVWMKKALIPFVVLNFIFYIRGTSKASTVEELFSRLPGHSCDRWFCTTALTTEQRYRLYLFGWVSTAIIALAAIAVAFFIES